MGNNIIDLNQFRNKPIFHYIYLLVFSNNEEKFYVEYQDVTPNLIKPVPYEDFLSRMTHCLITICQCAHDKHGIHPSSMTIEDFSVHLKEDDVTFYAKDLIPSLLETPAFQAYASI